MNDKDRVFDSYDESNQYFQENFPDSHMVNVYQYEVSKGHQEWMRPYHVQLYISFHPPYEIVITEDVFYRDNGEEKTWLEVHDIREMK